MDADRPAPTELREFEVTPEMIEAGLEHLFAFSHEAGNEEDVVSAIFRAMLEALPREEVSPS